MRSSEVPVPQNPILDLNNNYRYLQTYTIFLGQFDLASSKISSSAADPDLKLALAMKAKMAPKLRILTCGSRC
jgi:hypothetical protein